MKNEHLAIASVPKQPWGKCYTPEKALCIGTIFHDLNKPFFITDRDEPRKKCALKEKSSTLNAREQQMNKIMEISFYLDDLTLYLDTHPEDQDALNLFREYNAKRKELKADFTRTQNPLTRDCMVDCPEDYAGWCWQEGPMPWEGGCV